MVVGTTLDARYRVLQRLGEGGMGEVYLVEHIALGRKEALKVLHPTFANERTFVSRFRREARATNRMQHPNIVGVHDFGQLPDGRFYLSMEFVDGESLESVLGRGGPLPVPRALHLLHQLADAIDHAHSRGVIHRDLKPDNLLLVEHRGRADVLKVLDFGLAKIVAADHRESLETTRGEIFGTAPYMAPEQFNGEMTDARIDLYAFGCIAFEVLVGEPPFLGRAIEIMHKHVSEEPPTPSVRRPERALPRELDLIVLRCLAKDPDRRYQTGREIAEALSRVPGFGTHGISERRRLQSVRMRTLDAYPAEESTLADGRAPGVGDWRGLVDTWQEADPRPAQRLALRGAIERRLDDDVRDLRLTVGLGQMQEQEDDLHRVEAEIAALDRRTEELERSAREREAGLRFTLAELAFERQRSVALGERVPSALEQQIGELERRIAQNAKQLERELQALTDRSIDRVAMRAALEEQLDTLCAQLHGLLNEHL
jgi:Protein kinase domain